MPTTVLELLMHYFVSRELYIAHALSRHFSWSHNVLFPEDLPPGHPAAAGPLKAPPPTAIFLSGNDAIVPAKRTLEYLEAAALGPGAAGSFEVVWLEGMQHGELCLRPQLLDLVASKINERTAFH